MPRKLHLRKRVGKPLVTMSLTLDRSGQEKLLMEYGGRRAVLTLTRELVRALNHLLSEES
jgi:hypothetical protein